jgi:UDP-N-acetyl-D-mannosaminuronic acid transferase (WecB/TagA/CpsF family)
MQIWGIEGLYRVWQQPQRLPRLIRVFRILPSLAARRY